MRVSEQITYKWMASLDDASLLSAEARLHEAFLAEEKTHKRAVGKRYDLMRGPAELLAAWDRWSRISTETRSRGLHVRRQRRV